MGGGLKTKLTAHGRSFHPALGQAVEAYGMSRGPPPEGGWKYIARKDKTTMAEGSRRACEPCVRNQFTRLELLFHWGRLPRSGSRWKVRSPWGLCIPGPVPLPVVTLPTQDPPSEPDSCPIRSSPPAMPRAHPPSPGSHQSTFCFDHLEVLPGGMRRGLHLSGLSEGSWPQGDLFL